MTTTAISALQAPSTTVVPGGSLADSIGSVLLWVLVLALLIIIGIVLLVALVIRRVRAVRQRRTQDQASVENGDGNHVRVEQAGRGRFRNGRPEVEVDARGERAQPSSSTPGGVFISYRRQDTAPYARLLREVLSGRLDEEQVFMDVDSVEVGVDFAEAIERALASCTILLAVIGPRWATVTDAEGRRRLDDPEDIVRREIEAGLARNIRVVPVLVDGTPMPGRQQLPESLEPLARRNALELSYNRYDYDIEQLVQVVDKTLGRR